MNPNTEAVDTSQAPKFRAMAPGYEWKNDGKNHSMIVIHCLYIYWQLQGIDVFVKSLMSHPKFHLHLDTISMALVID